MLLYWYVDLALVVAQALQPFAGITQPVGCGDPGHHQVEELSCVLRQRELGVAGGILLKLAVAKLLDWR
jgi:hypothetical protein